MEEEYIQQLSPSQKQAYAIAKRNLGSSFNLSLSIGFLDWKTQQVPLPVPGASASVSNTPNK
jgi:hypothetical protein